MTVLAAMERYFAVRAELELESEPKLELNLERLRSLAPRSVACQVPPDVGRRLVTFGAVHCARIPPEIPAAFLSTPEDGERHESVRQRARQLVMDGGELDGLSQSAQSRILSSKTDRILDETFVARPLSYIRVHLWPKRFPLFHSVSWQSRVVAVGAEYVVVNKPSGVPVPPTVDNVLECVQTGAAQALGVDVETLHVTSRIDQPTEGLVVVGRSKAFVGRFNAAVRGDGTGGTTKKFYRAAAWVDDDVVRSPPWSEHMDVRHRVLVKHKAPMTPFVTLVCDSGPREKLVDCHMVIVSARALADGEHALAPVDGKTLVEFEIELVTGRTHQIRCQLSAMGFPLVGDALYEPLADGSMRERLLADPDGFRNVRPDGTRVLQEAEDVIGLQAFRLEFSGSDAFGDPAERVVFEAGEPWWRC